MNNLIDSQTFLLLYNCVFIFTGIFSLLLALYIDKNNKYRSKFINLITGAIILLFILLVGFRDYNVGVDTGNYYYYSWQLNNENILGVEFFFESLIIALKKIDASFTFFLLLIALMYYIFIYKSFAILSDFFKTPVLLIFLSFISLFFSLSMGVNIIRQGVSLSIILFAFMKFLSNSNKKKEYLIVVFFILFSLIIHTTSIIPFILFVLIYFSCKKINLRYFYVLYFIALLLAYFNFSLFTKISLFREIMGEDRRVDYLTNTYDDYIIGFKPQFVFFNTIFLFLFYLIKKRLSTCDLQKSFMYDILLKYYILSSIVFFMAFQIPYSDRWGLFSWIVIPILMAPAFSTQYRIFNKTILTLFFIFIYIFFQYYEN